MGSGRFGSVFSVGKFAFTQYELSNIAKTLMKFYVENDKFLIAPKEIGRFIEKKYSNKYSTIARQFFGGDTDNLSLDVWGTDYGMKVEENGELVILYSSGPDKQPQTKDDIAIDFETGEVAKSGPVIHAHEEDIEEVDEDDFYEEDRAAGGYDDEGYDEEGYDRYGFDKQGFDRDGYNRDGLHRDDL